MSIQIAEKRKKAEDQVITFIEKQPHIGVTPGERRVLIPVFMVKDGKNYFVVNRVEGEEDWKIEEYKKMLLSNGGRFFKFYGEHNDPFEMIRYMKMGNHHFEKPTRVFERSNGQGYGEAFTDFSGAWVKFAYTFHYRIYDEEMVRQLKAEVKGGMK